MDYASPAIGLYVLNGVLPEPDFPVVNPVLLVEDGYLWLAVHNGENVWHYDAGSDTMTTQLCDGIDEGIAIDAIMSAYDLNLERGGQGSISSVTKSDIIGRIG